MRKLVFLLISIVIIGMINSACAAGEPQVLDPTGLPATEVPTLEASPSETPLQPTLTSTPQPSPTLPPTATATPTPFLPDNLALLTYRTLGQVSELASLQLPGVVDLEFSSEGDYLRARVPLDEETHQDLLIDLETGEEILRLEGGQRIYFSQDAPAILALDGNEITSYDLISGEGEVLYSGEYLASALSPDGQLLVALEYEERGGTGTTFHVIDLPSGEERYSLYVNGTIDKEGFNFDQDGKNMAVSYFVPPGTYVATIWNAKSGNVVYTEYGFTEIILHPFGSEVAAASGRRSYISLVSTCTWEQRVYLGSAEDEPGFYAVTYADKGRLIYALSDRETTQAFFWYPPSGERIALDLGQELLAVSISPDRRLLASSDGSGSVTIWGILE